MLGIRRYKNRTLDLWCGEASDFVADVHCKSFHNGFTEAADNGARHLAVSVDGDPRNFFDELKVILDHSGDDEAGRHPGAKPQRITLILKDTETYYAFQKVMFEIFPEEV